MVRNQTLKNATIGQLAQAGGVSVETVRYYQRRGLMEKPERLGSAGHGSPIRRYGEQDVQRLRFIRRAQAAGFTLDEISELIVLDASEDRRRIYMLAKERIAALDEKIAELKTARNVLSRLAKDCSSSSTGSCPIISAFESVNRN